MPEGTDIPAGEAPTTDRRARAPRPGPARSAPRPGGHRRPGDPGRHGWRVSRRRRHRRGSRDHPRGAPQCRSSPGVYRMLDRKGDALYVGKARNLKARVQNYTHPAGLSNRLRRMISEIRDVRGHRHRHRSRGAAPRMQHDQAVDAALQCAAAGRQVVSVYPPDRRPPIPAAHQIPRHARQGRLVFRAVRLRWGGQPHPHHVAEGVSLTELQRQHLRQPRPPLPALSDQAVQRALRRAHRA